MASSIVIDFNANLTRFSSSLDKATADLNKFQSNTKRISGQIKGAFAGLGVGLTAAGFGAFIKKSIDAADAMSKLSQRTGVAGEELARLSFAADLSDVSQDQLATGLQKLSRNLVEAANGSKQASAGFTALKLDPRQFNTADEAFKQIAERFSKLPEGVGKTTTAIQLFGKSGADLIPLLNGGASELKKLGDEAERLGLVLSSAQLESAAEFNDNLRRMTLLSSGLANDAIKPLLPILNELGRSMASTSLEARESGESFSPLKKILESVIITGANVKFVFQGIGREIGGIAAQASALAGGSLSQARTIRQELIADGVKARKELDEFEKRIFNPSIPIAQKKPPPGGGLDFSAKSTSKSTGKKPSEPIDLFGSFLTRDKATADFIKEQFSAVNELQGQIAREESEHIKDQIDRIAGLRKEFISLIDPVEQYRVKLNEIDEAEKAGALSADQANAARFKINDAIDAQLGFNEAVKETDSIARDLGLTFTSAFEAAIFGGGKTKDIFRSLAEDIAKIGIRRYLTEPLLEAADAAFKFVSASSSGGSKSSGGGFLGGLVSSFFGGGGSSFNSSSAGFFEIFANGGIMSSAGAIPLNKYAGGGIANSPQLAIFGEGRQNEAFVPLPDGRNIPVTLSGGGGGGGGLVVNNYYNIDARGASPGVSQDIRKAIQESQNTAVERSVSKVADMNARGQLRLS